MADEPLTSNPQCAVHGEGPCICLGARYWMDEAKRLTGHYQLQEMS